MQGMRGWLFAGMAWVLVASGCTRGEPRVDGETKTPQDRPIAVAEQTPEPVIAAPPMSAVDSARVRARLEIESDSVRAAFARVQALGAREIAELRQDRNAEQIATAQRLGLRVSSKAEIEQKRRQNRLVALGDSTTHWVLREMEHSVPYVTPDTYAMLEQLGRRFHARLDRLGLPRYRIKVTSALRTDDTQASLRKTNTYASRTVSAHEFGTTVDVSHERFAVPADPRSGTAGASPDVRSMEAEILEQVGKEHAKALQAELGRAIAEMRDEGTLHVMMENQQPVYHITVARSFPPAG